MLSLSLKAERVGLSPAQVAKLHRDALRESVRLAAKDLGDWWTGAQGWKSLSHLLLDRPTPWTQSAAWASGLSGRVGAGLTRGGVVSPFVIRSRPDGTADFGIQLGFGGAPGTSRFGGTKLRSPRGFLSNVEARQKHIERVRLWVDPMVVGHLIDRFGNITNTASKPVYAEMIYVLSNASGLSPGETPKPPPRFASVGQWAEQRFGISRRHFRVKVLGEVSLAYFLPGGRLKSFAGIGTRLTRAPKKFNLESLIQDWVRKFGRERQLFHYRRLTQQMFRGIRFHGFHRSAGVRADGTVFARPRVYGDTSRFGDSGV